MSNCRCLLWTTDDLGYVLLTGHHPNCPDAPPVMDVARTLLDKLTKGIEWWASQEDGIPDAVWDAYAQAKAVLGCPVAEPKPQEGGEK